MATINQFKEKHKIQMRSLIKIIEKQAKNLLEEHEQLDYFVLQEDHHFVCKDGTNDNTASFSKALSDFIETYAKGYGAFDLVREITRIGINVNR